MTKSNEDFVLKILIFISWRNTGATGVPLHGADYADACF